MSRPAKLPAIVLAVFGASSAAAREVYSSVEERVRALYPGHEVARAYLSPRIVSRQRELGVVLPTLPETYTLLKEAGHSSVIVHPLLVVPGEEFAAVKAVECLGMAMEVADPLLTNQNDIDAAMAAIAPRLREHVPHVLVCHGNGKHSEYNQPLLRLKKTAESMFDNLVVASVEGEPGTEPLERAREMAKPYDEVVFVPFMMVAGTHVINDVMGDQTQSWRNIVGAAKTSCLEPLGKNPAIISIYLNHLKVAMQNLQKEHPSD
jgi:sirohydrochlorin cobaltochelatase